MLKGRIVKGAFNDQQHLHRVLASLSCVLHVYHQGMKSGLINIVTLVSVLVLI